MDGASAGGAREGADACMEALPGEAHVWLARPGDAPASRLAQKGLAWLSAEERSRHARFRFERDRETFLLAHALTRRVLGRYLGLAPQDVAFDVAPEGRPELASGIEAGGLRFNLSHARGLVGVVLTLDEDCGIDVETTGRVREPLALASRFFARAEVEDLRALGEAARRERFIRLWTLKEAYIKARGLGLALPLGAFAFTLGAEGGIGIGFDARIQDEPRSWQFHSSRQTGEHLLALALRRRDARARRVVFGALERLEHPIG